MLWLVSGELANIVFFFSVAVVFLEICGFIYGIYDSNEYIVRCSEPFLVTVCESDFLAMDDFHSFMFLSFVLVSVCVCVFS